MIYLRVGLFAEGPTDYYFLLGILDLLVEEIAVELFAGGFQLASAVGVDAPRALRDRPREERVAAAIEASWEECTLFVVHADGAGDAERARREQTAPGIARAFAVHGELSAVACVPVRETEAWMLADAGAFSRLFETKRVPTLPANPESESDPKKVLREALVGMGARGVVTKYYAELGKETRPEELRKLPAFRRFEVDLRAAIVTVAGLGGSTVGLR